MEREEDWLEGAACWPQGLATEMTRATGVWVGHRGGTKRDLEAGFPGRCQEVTSHWWIPTTERISPAVGKGKQEVALSPRGVVGITSQRRLCGRAPLEPSWLLKPAKK